MFNIPLGQFKYLCPLGVFMNLINDILYCFLFKGAIVYLNDLLTFSESQQFHVQVVREVLKLFTKTSCLLSCLSESSTKVNLTSCSIGFLERG